jgi:acyl-CoA synthetase (NDP forming)
MVEEVAKSPSGPRTYLVNPRYSEVGGIGCYPSLAELPEAVDLALLAVPDGALEEQVRLTAGGAARSAVIFGSAVDPAAGGPGPGLRERIASVAREAGMPLCGAGCMGFVNVARGLRAIGYTEQDPLPAGPVALVTHSGSVFSALLRSRRAFGFTVAISSGQELVTPAAAYARYALTLPETKVLALVLETIRDGTALRAVLEDAAGRDIPVLLLAAGTSAASRSLVAAHSGALAAGDGAWQALASAYGVHRVADLAELADTLELFCLTRPRAGAGREHLTPRHDPGCVAGHGAAVRIAGGRGIATVHDSGFERAHVADVAAEVGVPFAPLTEDTRRRLAAVLDPGLEPGNPLDVWGSGRDSEELFTETLSALADDPGVDAVALAVDLVPEYDGDDSYRDAVLAAAAKTATPVAVLASIPAAIDTDAANTLRAAGVPVLESTRTGLLALRHLLAHAAASAPVAARTSAPATSSVTSTPATAATTPDGCGNEPPVAGSLSHPSGSAGVRRGAEGEPRDCGESRDGSERDEARRGRWAARLQSGPPGGAALFDLLRDYGVPAVAARSAATRDEALAAADAIGYPVAVKTGRPDIAHKSDAGGVCLGIDGPAALGAAYDDLSDRLGPGVLVCAMASPGQELILGMARDPELGPLIVVGAGGILTEHLAERSVALPPLTRKSASALLDGQRFATMLTGVRGQPPCDIDALISAITGFSVLVADLGEHLDGFDINPLICSPSGVLAVDALAIPSAASRPLLA